MEHTHNPSQWGSDYCSCGWRLTPSARLVNLTPHPIVVRAEGQTDIVFPSEGVARCKVSTEIAFALGVSEIETGVAIPVARNVFGVVEGLPDPQPETFFIVSFPVLQAMVGKRTDLIGPDTSPNGGAIRDEKGQIVAVTRFQII